MNIHVNKPEKFNPKQESVGCFVKVNGKFILLLRNKEKFYGDKWGMPAGKIENGELEYSAMLRELKEELNLEIPFEKLDFFKTIYANLDGMDFIYHMYSTEVENIEDLKINPLEHQKLELFTPMEALDLDLFPMTDDCIKLFFGV